MSSTHQPATSVTAYLPLAHDSQELRVSITNEQGEVFEVLTYADGVWRDSTEVIGDHDAGLFGKIDDDFPVAGNPFATMIRDARRYFSIEEVTA